MRRGVVLDIGLCAHDTTKWNRTQCLLNETRTWDRAKNYPENDIRFGSRNPTIGVSATPQSRGNVSAPRTKVVHRGSDDLRLKNGAWSTAFESHGAFSNPRRKIAEFIPDDNVTSMRRRKLNVLLTNGWLPFVSFRRPLWTVIDDKRVFEKRSVSVRERFGNESESCCGRSQRIELVFDVISYCDFRLHLVFVLIHVFFKRNENHVDCNSVWRLNMNYSRV